MPLPPRSPHPSPTGLGREDLSSQYSRENPGCAPAPTRTPAAKPLRPLSQGDTELQAAGRSHSPAPVGTATESTKHLSRGTPPGRADRTWRAEMEAPSFASRRPAATSLPAFSLPPPDIPSTRYPASSPRPTAPTSGSSAQNNHLTSSSLSSPPPASQSQAPPPFPTLSSVLTPPSGVTTDGLSPLSAGVHSGSSQSSQPASTPGMYYSHVASTWATPGASSSPYGFSSNGANHSGSSSLVQPPYPSRQMYQTASPSVQQHFGRTAASPATTDGLATPSYAESSNLLNPASGGGASQQSQGPQQQQQQQQQQQVSAPQNTPTSGPPPADNSYRPPHPSGPYYPPSTAAQQQPAYSGFATNPGAQHSPNVSSAPASSAAPRTAPIPGHPGSLSGMAPPIGYGAPDRPHQSSYTGYHMPGNPVLSNMHHPGTPLAMVSGVGSMGMPHGYSPHGHHHSMGMYGHSHSHGHAQPAPQQDRPFKCDQCPQSFNRNHDLKRHKRIHLAVKPFPCTFCEKSFSRKDALKVRDRHNGEECNNPHRAGHC